MASKFSKASGLHRLADSVKQKPRALLSDADSAVNLIATDSVLCINNEPDSRQPLVEADRRVFHNGIELDAKMLFTRQANPDAASPNKRMLDALATRTSDNAIRPANSYHAAKRNVWIREVNDCLL